MNVKFTYCPNCSESMAEITEGGISRMKCSGCGYIQYMNPAPAAGVLVLEGNGILLVKRRYEPYKDLWVMPSGYIEYDEDVRKTAVREVIEETGLEVELDGIHTVESCFDDPRGNTILILYRAHVTGGELKAGDDAVDVGFFPLDGLPEIAFECHRKTLAHLAENLSPEENG